LQRLVKAFWNTCAGFGYAYKSEQAIRQEIFLLFMALPLSFVIAPGIWQAVAMIASLLLLLAVELLNTCAEKLCDHVTPALHPQIKIIKDMGSAAVFCATWIAGLVWLAAIAQRLGLF
jgi:diacylglycerol kinase (ATP)